jgi:hypothetical protein
MCQSQMMMMMMSLHHETIDKTIEESIDIAGSIALAFKQT